MPRFCFAEILFKVVENVCVASMPKSGSTFVRVMLQEMYPLHELSRPREVSYELCPSVGDLVLAQIRPALFNMHLLPSANNISKLKMLNVSKVIVLLRNPLDALTSFFYMCEEKAGPRVVVFPREYRNWTRERKLDYMLLKVYPRLTDYIELWEEIQGAPEKQLRVKLFYYEDMLQDRVTFFRSIADFVDLGGKDPSQIDFLSKRNEKTRFRRGVVGEGSKCFGGESFRDAFLLWARHRGVSI